MSIHSLYTNQGIASSSSFSGLEGLVDFVCWEGMGSLLSHCFLGLVNSSGVSKSRIAALCLRVESSIFVAHFQKAKDSTCRGLVVMNNKLKEVPPRHDHTIC